MRQLIFSGRAAIVDVVFVYTMTPTNGHVHRLRLSQEQGVVAETCYLRSLVLISLLVISIDEIEQPKERLTVV